VGAPSADPVDHTVEEYYASPEVRARIVEYAGGSATAAPTAAYLATLPERHDTFQTWDHPIRWPARELPRLLRSNHDLARSLWDLRSLVVFLDLDYQNVDAPGEPFLHPADVFIKLEPTFRAMSASCRSPIRSPMRLRISFRRRPAGSRGTCPVGHLPWMFG
jgi:hypothetical protein